MSDPTLRPRLKQVADLYKAGQKAEARRLIADIVKSNPNDADAWYIAGQVIEEAPKKMKAFERALAVNPAHQAARKALNDLRKSHSLLDHVVSEDLLNDDLSEFLQAAAPSGTATTNSIPDLSNPKILAATVAATLLVGIFLGALCLGTVNSGRFLGIVFAPTNTPSKTPTATPTATPSRTPTATVDIAATTTSLASTQQYFDATSTAKALLSEQLLAETQIAQQFSQTTTALAIINQQIETAIAGTVIANNQLFPTWTGTPFAGSQPTPPADGTPQLETAYTPLNFNFVDAEYSQGLDRIIFVSSSPNQLHIFNPNNLDDTIIELAHAPRDLSVGPDGLYAAVAHDGKISYVDLQNARTMTMLDVSGDVGEVTLGGNGWVYVISGTEQRIYAVNIASNTEFTTGSRHSSAEVRIHPTGLRLYTASRGVSPADISRFDLTDNIPGGGFDSRYHGDYDICGNIWFSTDGLHIFTPCGVVFRSSPDLEQDMIYDGRLQETKLIDSLVHVPGIRRVIGVSSTEAIMRIWDYDTYALVSMVRLPDLTVRGVDYPASGRYVFVSRDETQYYVIVQGSEDHVANIFKLLVGDLPR